MRRFWLAYDAVLERTKAEATLDGWERSFACQAEASAAYELAPRLWPASMPRPGRGLRQALVATPAACVVRLRAVAAASVTRLETLGLSSRVLVLRLPAQLAGNDLRPS